MPRGISCPCQTSPCHVPPHLDGDQVQSTTLLQGLRSYDLVLRMSIMFWLSIQSRVIVMIECCRNDLHIASIYMLIQHPSTMAAPACLILTE